MLNDERIKLWNAINRYTEACGGDTSNKTISDERMNAVSEVENIFRRIEDKGSV